MFVDKGKCYQTEALVKNVKEENLKIDIQSSTYSCVWWGVRALFTHKIVPEQCSHKITSKVYFVRQF